MNRARPQFEDGFTLVEMLISMAMGLIVISGVLAIYVSISGSSANTLGLSKLNAQMGSALQVMSNDIRRAGFWGNMTADDFDNPSTNPFGQIDVTALEVHANNVQVASNSAAGGDCILYSYDANNDGILDNSDITGFRLVDGVLQMRRNGDIAANNRHDSCTSDNDNWQNMTDPNTVIVNQLVFTLDNSVCINNREPDDLDNDGANGVDDPDEADCYLQPPVNGSGQNTIETREVAITISGQLANSALTNMTMTQNVRVRNDLVRLW
jgi:type IV pilus assembly protein PilW